MAASGGGQDHDGRGDPAAPAELLDRALGGDAEAQSDLGRWYLERSTHAERLEIGTRWFQAAARQGWPRADHNLGVVAVEAGDVPLARQHFQRAAEAGWVPSMMTLAVLLEEGGDGASAIPWYERAAEAGDVMAQG